MEKITIEVPDEIKKLEGDDFANALASIVVEQFEKSGMKFTEE